MYEAPVKTVGTVIREIKAGLFEVRYPNGKIAKGHFSKGLRDASTMIKEGATVELELTPFDFDSARISAVIGQDQTV